MNHDTDCIVIHKQTKHNISYTAPSLTLLCVFKPFLFDGEINPRSTKKQGPTETTLSGITPLIAGHMPFCELNLCIR